METDNIITMDTDSNGEKIWERHEALGVSITYELQAILIFCIAALPNCHKFSN